MEEYKEKFLSTFEKFIKEIYKVHKTKDVEKVLKAFNKFDVTKLSKKFFSNMDKHSEHILEMNESMFSSPVVVLSGINLSEVWDKLNDSKKKRFFVYIKMLYILSEVITKENDYVSFNTNLTNRQGNMIDASETSRSIDTTDATNPTDSSSFDPYEGVGEDNVYDVNAMYNNVNKFKPSETGPSLGNIAELIGLDKMLDLNELTDQLKNMDEDAIDEATKNIQGMMGGNMDDKTMSAITGMLGSISNELKTRDMKSGNLFDNLSNIANVVAEKMRPQIDNGEIDVKNLWHSTKSLASKCKDESGNTSGINPMEILSKMVDTQIGPMENVENVENMENVNDNGASTVEIGENDYKKILEDMGLGHVDLASLDASTLSMLQQIRKGDNQ